MSLRRARDLGWERAGVLWAVEPNIVDTPAVRFEFAGEVTHRGEDEGDLLFMVRGVIGLACNLGHEHDVP